MLDSKKKTGMNNEENKRENERERERAREKTPVKYVVTKGT